MKQQLQNLIPQSPVLKAKRSFLLITLLFIINHIYSQQSYTFTNCGATGSVGPTQTQVNNTYTTTNLNGQVTSISGIQQWTVPATGLYRVTAWGASGGDATSYTTSPGNGAIIAGDFTFNVGDIVRVLVGQMGQDRTFSAGGGGGSFVTRSPHNTTTAIVVVAGGGGAPSQDYSGISATVASCGMFDQQSGPGQCNGDGGISFTGNSGGGGGGFLTNGQNGGIGNGGQSYVNGGLGGATNNLQQGGFGGGGGQNGTGTYAGSGGGGFSGGNGGNRNSTVGTGRMGGGGGGSFNNGTNQLNSINTTTGHGRVVITELCSVTLSNTASGSGNASICSGITLTLTTNGVSNYSWSTGSTASSVVVTPTVTTVYSLSATSPSACTSSAQMTVFVTAGLPTLSIAQTTNNICLGQAVTFTASGAATYTWLTGAWTGTIANGVSFTPPSSSSYTVTGQNACGTGTAATNVSITPLSVVGISSPPLICAGGTSTLGVAAAATSFSWLPGNFVTSSPSLVVSPLLNTNYTVAASDGTCAGTTIISVTANPVPTISAMAASTLVCVGDPVVLTASGGVNYTWTPGNLSGATVTVNPTTPTAYNVVGDNSFGCTSVTSAIVITTPGPTLNVNASDQVICLGQAVTLTVTGATTYTWNTGPNTTTISDTPSVTSVYTVTGTSNGCEDTQSIAVGVVNPTVIVSGTTSACADKQINVSATGANSYTWLPGSVTFSALSVSLQASTVYTLLSVTNQSNISCANSSTVLLTLLPSPTVTAVPERSVICRDETTTITAGGASTYTWSGASGTGNTAVTGSSLVTTVLYTVTGTAANGCSSEALGLVMVNGCNSIHENTLLQAILRVYPNPSSGEFNIESDYEVIVQIVNQLGQVVKLITLNQANNYRFASQNFDKGIYFINTSGKTTPTNFKVVVN